MAALPEVMVAPAIEEREVRTYTNIEHGLPVVGSSVEVLYFFLTTRQPYPLQTYSIYKGTVVQCDGESITLALGAICTYVTELETVGERAARQNAEGGVQLTTFGNHNIYWKVEASKTSIPRTPERRKRRLRAIELYIEPITPTKPISAKYGTPTTTMVSPTSLYGGKRTKRRKSKRKSRRK